MEKVQNLFVIIGTNPMPNVIAIDQRVEKGGKVVFIGTESLKVNSSNLSEIIKEAFIEEELDVETIYVDALDDKNVYEEVLKKAETLEGSIELNYTGGTKAMSSGAYDAFRKLKRKKYLSYVDTPREELIIEYIDEENNQRLYLEKALEKDRFNKRYGLNMILRIHGIKGENVHKNELLKEESIELFEMFEKGSIEEKRGIIESLEEIDKFLNNYRKNVSKENMDENYVKEGLEEKLKGLYGEQSTNKIIETLKKVYKNDLNKYRKYLIGENLEIYFDNVLSKLQKQGDIDEYFWSYVEKNKEKKDKFEIDFIIKKGYKIGLISVTMCDYEEAIRNKGNEAKIRARQLAGDKTEALLIAFYEGCTEIEEELDKGRNYNGKTKIIGINNFYNMEQKLKEWIKNDNINIVEEKKEKRGICIVGGAKDVAYISIKGILKTNVDRLILIGTRNDNKERGTIKNAEELKEIFKEKNIEIDIVEIPKNSILEIEDVLKNKVIGENITEEIIIDYTGGTKLHSCVIKSYIERECDVKKIKFEKRYVDYQGKSILINNEKKIAYEEFEDTKEDLENLFKLKGCYLKGNNIISDRNDEKIKCKKVEVDRFTFKFTVDFEKCKEKLKLLKLVSKFEEVGGKYCIVNIDVKEKDVSNARKVAKQFFGIKESMYKGRILINNERV
ncbi:MAG: hypothetical protein ACRC30_09315 [Clostridium sp.]